MKELSLNEIRKIQISILDETVKFCDDNNIKYFLCGGTLLGAIRHKGYIPWDDDIDIMMPREDFERFKEIHQSKNLTLMSQKLFPNFYYPFYKVSDNSTLLHENSFVDGDYEMGVNIDVFPIDNIPDDPKERTKFFKKGFRLRKYLKQKRKKVTGVLGDDILRYIGRKLLSPIHTSKLYKLLYKYATAYNNMTTEYQGIVVWGYGKRECCRKEVFEGIIEVEFEGKMYKAPAKYDEYLSNVYGDYMSFPPAHKQVSPHVFKVYLRD